MSSSIPSGGGNSIVETPEPVIWLNRLGRKLFAADRRAKNSHLLKCHPQHIRMPQRSQSQAQNTLVARYVVVQRHDFRCRQFHWRSVSFQDRLSSRRNENVDLFAFDAVRQKPRSPSIGPFIQTDEPKAARDLRSDWLATEHVLQTYCGSKHSGFAATLCSQLQTQR
jgi:hypothetical protein